MHFFKMKKSLVHYKVDCIFRICGRLKEQLPNNAVHLLEQRSETKQLINYRRRLLFERLVQG